MTATWKIAACDRTVSLGGEADVITNVHWDVTDKERSEERRGGKEGG